MSPRPDSRTMAPGLAARKGILEPAHQGSDHVRREKFPNQRPTSEAIGAKVTVSSFRKRNGRRRRSVDGSNRTISGTPASSRPGRASALTSSSKTRRPRRSRRPNYATWSGGNGNGQVEAYAIHFSDNGKRSGQAYPDRTASKSAWLTSNPFSSPKKPPPSAPSSFSSPTPIPPTVGPFASVGKLGATTTLSKEVKGYGVHAFP